MTEPTKIDFHHRRISQLSDFIGNNGKTPTLMAPPTGKEISMVGCVVSTWENGKIVEEWVYNDYMGLTHQFGVVPLAVDGFV
mgnify:CR=1 FL=1